LKDGRVLLAGGDISGLFEATETAEIYDPATGKFSPTGSMTIARAGHSASLLPDGRVLIAGGSGGNTAEIYDPASGSFSQTGAMLEASYYQTATTLKDGRVLLAGGTAGSDLVKQAEIYDPASGQFTRTGSLRTAREGATATLLQDGRVLVAGGDQGLGGPGNQGAVFLKSAEIYAPATGEFASAASMADARTNFAATLLNNGQVLVAGGEDSKPATNMWNTAELYSPATGKWSRTGSMAASRSSFGAALLGDGRVLMVGGTGDSPGLELYDPASGTFSAAGSTLDYFMAVRLLDGRVLLPGIPSEIYWP
jgi:hypothetical protein